MEGIEERRKKTDKETREEESRSRKRGGEKGEEETVVVKRRCVKPFSCDAFEEVKSRGGLGLLWGILGETFWVTPVVCLSVCLGCRRVCKL